MESYGPASAHHNSLCWASITTFNFCKWKDPWPWVSFGPTCLQSLSLMSCSGSSPFKNPAYLGEMYTHMYTNLFTFISEVFGQPKVNSHSLKEFFLRHRVNARIEFPFYLVSYQILCQDPPPHPIFFGAPGSGLSLCPQHGVGLQRQISAPGSRIPPGRRLAWSVPPRRRPGSLLSSISRKKKKNPAARPLGLKASCCLILMV